MKLAGDPPQVAMVAAAPTGKLGEDEVLVRVHTVVLSSTDILAMEANESLCGLGPKAPWTPGQLLYGRVESLGRCVTGLKEGSFVLGFKTCGTPSSVLAENKENKRQHQDGGGEVQVHGGGTFRELAVLSCVNVVPVDDAAALKMPSVLGVLYPLTDALLLVHKNMQVASTDAIVLVASHTSDLVFILHRLALHKHEGPIFVFTSDSPSIDAVCSSPFLKNVANLKPRLFSFLHSDLRGLENKLMSETCQQGCDQLYIDSSDTSHKDASLFRALLGLVSLHGKVTLSSHTLELGPFESQHLYSKNAAISFFSPHALRLASGNQFGLFLHMVVEVLQRIKKGEVEIPAGMVKEWSIKEFPQGFRAMGRCRGTKDKVYGVFHMSALN